MAHGCFVVFIQCCVSVIQSRLQSDQVFVNQCQSNWQVWTTTQKFMPIIESVSYNKQRRDGTKLFGPNDLLPNVSIVNFGM